MKLGQLKKKVIREFAKSPAKTVILIALCPVALYFVVPLLLPAKGKVNEPKKAEVVLHEVPPIPAPTWQQLVGWIEVDGWRKPGSIAADLRNPFQKQKVEVKKTIEVEVAATEVVRPILSQARFESLGFKLTSVVFGHHASLATINGERYLAGETVELPSNRQGGIGDEPPFVLKQIARGHVVLELEGRPYRLEFQKTERPGSGIRFGGSSRSTR